MAPPGHDSDLDASPTRCYAATSGRHLSQERSFVMHDTVRLEIETKLNLSADELLSELAAHTVGTAIAPDLKRRGREIYDALKARLLEKICMDPRVTRAYTSVREAGLVVLVAALLDCVSGYISGVSPVTFCVLLAKEGVEHLCESYWHRRGS
jgi:hypothetical protein